MTGDPVRRPEDKPSAPVAERPPLRVVTGRSRETGMDPAAPDHVGGTTEVHVLDGAKGYELAGAEPGPAERLLALVEEELAGAEPGPAERLLALVEEELARAEPGPAERLLALVEEELARAEFKRLSITVGQSGAPARLALDKGPGGSGWRAGQGTGKEARVSEEPPDFSMLPWDDLHPRLLIAARGKMGRLFWRGGRRGQVPGGRTEHDFVQTAVQKLLAGERRWNPDKTAFENVWGAVSGEISKWAASADDTTTSRAYDGEVALLRADRRTPEDHALWRRERDRLLTHLRAMDAEAAWMAELIMDQGLGHAELARAMELEQPKVDAIVKRLKRLLTAYFATAREVERWAAG